MSAPKKRADQPPPPRDELDELGDLRELSQLLESLPAPPAKSQPAVAAGAKQQEFKWKGLPGRLAATAVGLGYTGLVFRKMIKPGQPKGPVIWLGFAAGATVNVLLCNLLFAFIEDEMVR